MAAFILRRPPGFAATPSTAFFGKSLPFAGVCPSRIFLRTAFSREPPTASIQSEVSQKLKEAMKSRDTDALKALRGIRAAFLTALKEPGVGDTLPDNVAVAQLRKLAKMRKESIEMFKKGGRDDLVQAERKELDVIEQWLPTLADAEQTTLWVKEAIEKTGASRKGDMGKVMGYVFEIAVAFNPYVS